MLRAGKHDALTSSPSCLDFAEHTCLPFRLQPHSEHNVLAPALWAWAPTACELTLRAIMAQ
eukprot:8217374-Alexandrium_andersonii.AAC.1